MKIYITTILSCLLCHISFAGIGVNVSKHNDSIPEEVRNEVHEINNKVVEGISSGDIKTLKAIELDSSITLGDMEKMSKQLSPVMAGKKFTSSDDYFIKYTGIGKNSFPIPSETEIPFTILLELESGKPYFASLVTTHGEHTDFALTLVYVKKKNTWKLQGFNAGQIRIAGRNAVQWFEEAKEMAQQNHNLPALLRLQMATSQILRPAPYIQYKKESEIIELSKSLQGDFGEIHKFPLEMSELKNSPTIYYITPEFVQNDLLPLIKYVTSNSLDDKSALQDEAELMTGILQERFPGITDYYSYIAFKAFSEPPTDPKRTYKAFGVTVEVNKTKKNNS